MVDALAAVMKELAIEIDSHYDDEDFFALSPTIEALRAAAKHLEKHNHELPDVVAHVFKRYQRAHN